MDYGFTLDEHFAAIEAALAELSVDDMMSAMEADTPGTPNTLTQTAKKSATTDFANNKIDDKSAKEKTAADFIKDAKDIQEKILKTLGKVENSIAHLMQSTLSTNNEFIGSIEDGKFQLQDSIEVINWTYGHDPAQYLHPKLSKMHAIIQKNVGFLRTWDNLPDDAIIKNNGNAVEEALLRDVGAAASITSYRQYAVFTQTQFRGKKSKVVIQGAVAPKFIQEIKTFGNYQRRFSTDANTVKQVMQTAFSTVSTHMNNSQLGTQEKQQIMKMYRNIAKMCTIYTNLIQFVYRLHVEYILNHRAILRRLYQK